MQETVWKVLVVEDDAFTASWLRFMLEREQMQVCVLSDGHAALAQLAQPERFDAVVLDWMLPQASGLEVLTRLRSLSAWADTPVLVLSALDDAEPLAAAFAAGASDYLCKPFNPQAFMARLRRLLSPRAGAPRADA